MENVLIGFTSKILSYYRIYSQGWIPSRKIRKLPPQGVSQPGIFSTFLPGEHVPCWFSSKFTEPYTSLQISFLHNSRVKSLSFCVVYKRSKVGESKRTNAMRQQLTFSKALVARQRSLGRQKGGISSRRVTYRPLENKEYETSFDCPSITVENVRRCWRRSRQAVFYGVPDGKEGMMWLSDWRFGRDELSCDDGVEVSVSGGDGIAVKEFGVKVLYVEEEEGSESSMVWASESCRERERDASFGEAYGFSVRLPPTYRSLQRARESYLDSVPH
nr:TMV resistance protein N-like isoform X1 [Ipomoea batatas]